ncbi:MAG TPA: diadenylate cyclase CdaA [Spirochaetota bacterium]|nr:diadenylate cyclase CdaA [Spirochaetota bacterium]HOM37898.1 diadenylate cyclase CdaA [Spirochaetota bacterium]HPQ48702.1 diadenylate cyclase CdaA [Spirochaetota bacterium]
MELNNIIYYITGLVEIIGLTVIIYNFVFRIIDVKTKTILKLLVILGIFFIFSKFFILKTFVWIFEKIIEIIPIALIIIFQKEIKNFINSSKTIIYIKKNRELKSNIEKVLNALNYLSSRKIGSLIYIDLEDQLKDIKERSVPINSEINEEIIISLFMPSTPLHDGAIIMNFNKILYARAFFPITEKDVSKYLGSRHRAAIGITEISNGIALTTSEENGYISLFYQGKIFYNLGLDGIRKKIFEILGMKDER